ncbi:MAG: RNA methyltransferase, partial [Caldilineaceae bacterium]|nr:RNA methyltransferase [Caldilineaceae bacterium]
RIKNVVKLQQNRQRRQQGRFLVEGYRALWHAAEQHYPIEELYYCPPLFFGTQEPHLLTRLAAAGTQLVEVTPEVFGKIAVRGRPEGLLAVAQQRSQPLTEHKPPANAFYLIAEAVEKPGNLGTLIRSADGAGASGLIVCDPCTDIWHPDVIRGSVGAFFALPIFECDSQAARAWCRQHGITILAATPQATALYTEVDMTGPVAVAVGTEQVGLSEAWLTQADQQLRLPMLGTANSLNVAVAATILLYDVVRQRLP